MATLIQHKQKIGLPTSTALVVGGMIGSGAFLLPADLAPLGLDSILGWLATIAGTLCLCVVVVRLARGLGGESGPYAYPAAAFGPGAGFIVAWSYWITLWVGNATLAVAAIRNLALVAPALAAPGFAATGAIGLLWLFTGINCLGVRAAGGVQVGTTLLKLIPLFGAIFVGCWLIGRGAPFPAEPGPPVGAAGIGTAATLAFFAMLGFENASVAAERVKDPERTIPRATYYGVALAGFLYLFACSTVTLMLPAATVHASNAPFATFFATFVHPALGPVIAAFAAISALGALNGYVLLQGELPLSLAERGLFPSWFAAANRRNSPYRIHLLSSGLATLLIFFNFSRGLAQLFQFMLLVTTSTAIIFYVAAAAAALKLAREGRIAGSPGFAIVAAAGIAYSLWAFYGAGIEPSLWSLAMTAAGLPLYFLMRRTNGREASLAALPESAA